MASYLSDRSGARYLDQQWTRRVWSLSSRSTQDSRQGDREIFVIWRDVPGEIEHRASRRHWGATLPLHKGRQAGKLGNHLANKTQLLLIGFILLLLVEMMQN